MLLKHSAYPSLSWIVKQAKSLLIMQGPTHAQAIEWMVSAVSTSSGRHHATGHAQVDEVSLTIMKGLPNTAAMLQISSCNGHSERLALLMANESLVAALVAKSAVLAAARSSHRAKSAMTFHLGNCLILHTAIDHGLIHHGASQHDVLLRHSSNSRTGCAVIHANKKVDPVRKGASGDINHCEMSIW